MRKIVFTTVLTILAIGISFSQAPKRAAWDPNTEPDIAGYRIYTCPKLPCSFAAATRIGEVLHPTTTFTLPLNTEGQVFVTAFDTSKNESVESNIVPFDLKPPAKVQGVRVE